MRYALIKNGKVANIIEADAEFAAGLPGFDAVVASTEAGVGWDYANGMLIAPEVPDELCILGAVIYYNGLQEYKDAFRKFSAMTAKEIMTEKVLTVKENDDVSKVAKIMLDKHIKRLPVMDGDKLAGIVSRSDIVKMLL